MTDRCPTCRKPWKRRVRKPRVDVKAIRAAVAERAGHLCECGCGRDLLVQGAELDHWLGGSGRRKEKASVETCWMLSRFCHRERTRNEPYAAYWNGKFRDHCRWYGYPFTAHVEKQPVRRRSA